LKTNFTQAFSNIAHAATEHQWVVQALAFASVLAVAGLASAATWQAFKPGGQTVLVSATTTAASVTLNGSGGSLLVFNACTVPVRIDFTGGTATTPAVGVPGDTGIPANTLVVLEMGTGAPITTVSVKVDSGAACNVEITRGEGMSH
jgi:hypothetical protein